MSFDKAPYTSYVEMPHLLLSLLVLFCFSSAENVLFTSGGEIIDGSGGEIVDGTGEDFVALVSYDRIRKNII